MSVEVTVKRTAMVTITMSEFEASYVAALVGNVGGVGPIQKALQDVYAACLAAGLTPPRSRDVFVFNEGGATVREMPNGSEAPK